MALPGEERHPHFIKIGKTGKSLPRGRNYKRGAGYGLATYRARQGRPGLIRNSVSDIAKRF